QTRGSQTYGDEVTTIWQDSGLYSLEDTRSRSATILPERKESKTSSTTKSGLIGMERSVDSPSGMISSASGRKPMVMRPLASGVMAARVSGESLMRAWPEVASPSLTEKVPKFMAGEPMKPATKTLAGRS